MKAGHYTGEEWPEDPTTTTHRGGINVSSIVTTTTTNPKPKGDPRFHAVLREMGDLHDRKQLDYGRTVDPFANVRASEDFGVEGWVGCLIRANDKMRRLQKAASGGELANESIRDSLLDLANYAAIALVLYDESQGTENERTLI